MRPGAPPGTLIADPAAPAPTIHVMAYGAEELVEERIESLDRVSELCASWPVTWVNVEGLGDARMIERVGRIFGLHPLAQEDVLNTHQRAKIEAYPDHLFIVLRMTTVNDAGPEGEQISIFLGRGYVVTFQERSGDPLNEVRRRIREGLPRMRGGGADYLAYAILDAVVDQYFPVLEAYGDHLDVLEDEVFVNPGPALMQRIHELRRDLTTVRRAVWPLRDVLSTLLRGDMALVADDTRVFLRDAYDHVLRLLDMLETDREVVASVMDAYLSSVSNRMNEVMKVLTIIATIFIPLSFIASVYGMNFDTAASPLSMPELHWYYGYPAALGLMLAVALSLLYFFRRRGWLGALREPRGPPREGDPM